MSRRPRPREVQRAGVIGIASKGQPRKPDDWGALRAWGWGVSRLIDYFEAHPELKILVHHTAAMIPFFTMRPWCRAG